MAVTGLAFAQRAAIPTGFACVQGARGVGAVRLVDTHCMNKGKHATMDTTLPTRDLFAEIAAHRQASRDIELVIPAPRPLPKRVLPLDEFQPTAVFTPQQKMETPEQLSAELRRQREQHAPFLRDLAPALPETRITVPIEVFDWRLQTEADRADFTTTLRGEGAWEPVSIPHYGGPLGRAVAYYRTTIQVTEAMLAKGALFVCCRGVDYTAHVFLNGTLLGTHEGFFAPFQFEATAVAHIGENTLLIEVGNDAIGMGNTTYGTDGHLYEGDKLYAATGPGYDDPEVGWHHCPPGMGIYQSVFLEARAPVHAHDLFVRPITLDGEVEAWIEVWNSHRTHQDVTLSLSVYGQNFPETALHAIPITRTGLGPGVNYLRVPLALSSPRVWEPATPWLYQLQVRVLDAAGQPVDTAARQFGLRTFRMEEDEAPKGRFFLNGREIRLRGANTMGFEQQDVMKGDWPQLIDDILLAKICHMNFWRITQRPVQAEVYDYCDRLGLMTQTDLPLFGCLRRNQFCEAVRQAEEMERLVRAHPCNILVSYINEPFRGAMDKPHRHLLRDELERFFVAADQAVRLANPDRVIKAVDGDYDPPAPGIPDNHCYCGWYNGHGIDLGKLHQGYWQAVKPGWCYGCGEFGAEGLDPVETMRKYYPPSWLPQTPEEEAAWTPDRILQAQTGRFHYLWFETQHSLADWVQESQRHQADMTRLMTEAFRRDARMVSCAIHLFIDAFPSGWMKAIMDVDRNPKPAYFAYREALTPLMVNLRTDRWTYWATDPFSLDVWICNDTLESPPSAALRYCLEVEGEILASGCCPVQVPVGTAACLGVIQGVMPVVTARTRAIVRLALVDAAGVVLHDTSLPLVVCPSVAVMAPPPRACVIGSSAGPAARLAAELALPVVPITACTSGDVLLIDDPTAYADDALIIRAAVQAGACAFLLEWPAGTYQVAGTTIKITPCGLGARYTVARATGDPLVADLHPEDLRFWYDPEAGTIAFLLATTVTAPAWSPILQSGNGDWSSSWEPTLAAAEYRDGQGVWRLCQLQLAGRTHANPVAALLARRLIAVGDPARTYLQRQCREVELGSCHAALPHNRSDSSEADRNVMPMQMNAGVHT